MLSDPTKSHRVCVTRNPWPPLGLSWHSPACCSLTPCPAFLAARRLILPKMISSPSGRSSRRGPGALQHSPGLVGSRSGWVTSECGSGMMQGPAARHTAPVSHCSSVTALQHGVPVAGMMLQPPRMLSGQMTTAVCLVGVWCLGLIGCFCGTGECFNAVAIFMLRPGIVRESFCLQADIAVVS